MRGLRRSECFVFPLLYRDCFCFFVFLCCGFHSLFSCVVLFSFFHKTFEECCLHRRSARDSRKPETEYRHRVLISEKIRTSSSPTKCAKQNCLKSSALKHQQLEKSAGPRPCGSAKKTTCMLKNLQGLGLAGLPKTFVFDETKHAHATAWKFLLRSPSFVHCILDDECHQQARPRLNRIPNRRSVPCGMPALDRDVRGTSVTKLRRPSQTGLLTCYGILYTRALYKRPPSMRGHQI